MEGRVVLQGPDAGCRAGAGSCVASVTAWRQPVCAVLRPCALRGKGIADEPRHGGEASLRAAHGKCCPPHLSRADGQAQPQDEVEKRIAGERLVHPHRAGIHRAARHLHRVQPPAGPLPRLQNKDAQAGVCQVPGGGEACAGGRPGKMDREPQSLWCGLAEHALCCNPQPQSALH